MTQGRLPDFLIIGAMKSGTSSLHDYLNLHPDIYMSEPKEIHYYADQFFKTHTLEWYKSFFVTKKKLCGTSPQSYTKYHNKFYQNIPERIYKDSPNIKLIYIVRDPIKRYISHIKESHFGDPKEDILYAESIDHYLKTSMYYDQISQYLTYFKKDQIYILSLEELVKNKLEELNNIFNFLDVAEVNDVSLFNFVSNQYSSNNIPFTIRINIFYRIGMKIAPSLTKKIGILLSKKYYHQLEKKYELTDEKLNELKFKLKKDIDQFRKFSGKKFKEWSV